MSCSGPHSYSGIHGDRDSAISTCGMQDGLQCQHLAYPHRKKEKEMKRKKKSRRKKEKEIKTKEHTYFLTA